ncbi:MAG: hypothetical protein NWE92_05010 [Candidatus Bathyarchaeota archaeon]|nr:hypothetical protein [Candidatus Bathyarchaeota archaeon]
MAFIDGVNFKEDSTCHHTHNRGFLCILVVENAVATPKQTQKSNAITKSSMLLKPFCGAAETATPT